MSAETTPGNGRRSGVLGLVAVLAVAAGIWFGVRFFTVEPGPAPLDLAVRSATLLPQPKPLAPFSLTDQDGRQLSLDDLRGRWTFVSFGYTSCPDICPTTMATFDALDREINPEGGQPEARFLLVSVDPERDTPERLAQYVRWFNPGFLGATGDHEQLRALSKQLGVMYARAEQQDTAMGYLVDHSGAILLLDPEGRLAAIFSAPHQVPAMAADFETISQYDRN